MKTNLIFMVSVLSVLLFSTCKKCKIKNLNSISYGTSFGMCGGYCVQSISISDAKLTFTKSKHGQTPDTKTCSKNISDEEVNSIKDLLNASQIANLPELIGCPDCADGGAEWISVTADGKTHKITYDYGKPPKELEAAAAKLKVLKDGFKDCN
ncbi:MAG: hypothetical protein EOO93_23745 [Pedobacter sp.]|nr:MAG: hypothetical protein EOO93_23745 [Pedobacter sp.]